MLGVTRVYGCIRVGGKAEGVAAEGSSSLEFGVPRKLRPVVTVGVGGLAGPLWTSADSSFFYTSDRQYL